LPGDPDPGTEDVVGATEGQPPVEEMAGVDIGGDGGMVDQQPEVLPHTHDVRGHRDLVVPAADGHRAVAVEDLRCGSVDQGAGGPPIEVEAAVGVGQPEAAVPRGRETTAVRRRDPVRHRPGAAGLLISRVQGEAQQPRVHPGDPGQVRRVSRVGPQVRGPHGRPPVHPDQGPPVTLARQGRSGEGPQPRHVGVAAGRQHLQHRGRRCSADRGRVQVVLQLLEREHHHAQPVAAGPTGEARGRRVRPGGQQRLPHGYGEPDRSCEQTHEEQAHYRARPATRGSRVRCGRIGDGHRLLPWVLKACDRR
jgi:hypothetical protein